MVEVAGAEMGAVDMCNRCLPDAAWTGAPETVSSSTRIGKTDEAAKFAHTKSTGDGRERSPRAEDIRECKEERGGNEGGREEEADETKQ